MENCFNMLFGHNFEITRSAAFGGIYSEKINNRKFAAKKDGFPLGFYKIESPDECGMGQTQEQLYFESGREYSIRIWAKCEVATSLTYCIKTKYFKIHYKKTVGLIQSDEYMLIEDKFTLYSSEKDCVFEVTYPCGSEVSFMAFSIKETDSFYGMRKDVIENLKLINSGNLRYPGGCYAECYNWKEGLLPVDFRPSITQKHHLDFLLPATYDIDTHEIGTDEFIALCKYLDTEPEITVRLSDNTPEDAADWVEYCNGSADTKWGGIRAKRGFTEPYNVKIWFIGNELCYCGEENVSDYEKAAVLNNSFVKAMKAVDDSITVVCSTGLNDEWDKNFFSKKPLFDWISLHNYLIDTPQYDCKSIDDIQKVVNAPNEFLLPKLESFCELNNGASVSFDEWNYCWGKRGNAMTALYVAGVLHVLMRNAKRLNIVQACYFTPLNEGAIRIYPHESHLNADGLIYKMLSKHKFNRLVEIENTEEDLDILKTKSQDNKTEYISIINRNIYKENMFKFDCTNKKVRTTILSPHNNNVASDKLQENHFEWIIDVIPPMSVMMIEICDEL